MDSITKLLSDRIADLERILDKRDAEIAELKRRIRLLTKYGSGYSENADSE